MRIWESLRGAQIPQHVVDPNQVVMTSYTLGVPHNFGRAPILDTATQLRFYGLGRRVQGLNREFVPSAARDRSKTLVYARNPKSIVGRNKQPNIQDSHPNPKP